MITLRRPGLIIGLLSVFLSLTAHAQAAVDTLNVDLAPLIDAAAKTPDRFAVDIPHGVTTSSGGTWTESGDQAFWEYTVRVPTAVSLSFHAIVQHWPASAVLTVSNGTQAATLHANDAPGGQLWSPVSKGDTLTLRFALPVRDRPALSFAISSLQAGYRSLVPGGEVHPRFRVLQATGETAEFAACQENYECHVNAANDAPSRSVVVVFVGNQFQCTGTLLNDVAQDGKPYVLTARHCQGRNPGENSPDVAASVRVMWNAVTACGQTLRSVYEMTAPSQTGATTRVEQQDAWVIELNQPPVITDSYFAGWDATGAALVGGYSIHHGDSLAKQYVEWFGQALPVVQSGASLNLPYDSSFLSLSTGLGSIGPGASGSAIFDSNNRLVGSLSRALASGACPAIPPQPPTPGSTTTLATSFAAVFDSTADSTSSTGSITLASLLDPGHTGARTQDATGALPPPPFTSSDSTARVNTSITLSWSAPLASSCTAAGGESGDGWSGTLPSSGSVQVTETVGSVKTYLLECSVGSQKQRARVTVSWLGNAPYLIFRPPASFSLQEKWVGGTPLLLDWSTNIPPCTWSDGTQSGTLNDVTGTLTVGRSTPGLYEIQVTCGSGDAKATSSYSIPFVTPSLTFTAQADHVVIKQTPMLQWKSGADRCAPSGGGPNDAWTALVFQTGSGNFTPAETVAGTYTFGLTCTSGAVSLSNQVTVTYAKEPVAGTLTISSVPDHPPGNVVLDYRSNVANCTVNRNGDTTDRQWSSSFKGQVSWLERNVGTVTYVLSCLDGTVTKAMTQVSVTLTRDPPIVTLTTPSTQVTVGDAIPLTWSATNFDTCYASGAWEPSGLSGNGGTLFVGVAQAGSFTYNMTCSASGQSTTASVTVTANDKPATPPPQPPSSGGSGSSAGGGGGGGRLDVLVLAFLSLVALANARARRRVRVHAWPH